MVRLTQLLIISISKVTHPVFLTQTTASFIFTSLFNIDYQQLTKVAVKIKSKKLRFIHKYELPLQPQIKRDKKIN
jgi:hypothetical protein